MPRTCSYPASSDPTRSRGRYLPWLLAPLLLLGCSGRDTVDHVAKQWALTLRASQVLPVYPLTEDLQPGDVFLVTLPIQRQQAIYHKRGYLPLDQLVTRLHTDPSHYSDFYADAYFQGDYQHAPHPRDGSAVRPVAIPAARFPTYQFRVSRAAGLTLALPVQGIPLALNLLKSDQAVGSVSLRKAFTYAQPGDQLLAQLLDWASHPDTQAMLAAMAQAQPTHAAVYLRVVQRVYLVGGVDVQLFNTQRQRTTINAAASALPSPARPVPAAGLIPAASVQVQYATDRTVALREDFDRRLVMGYLGFDLPILADGSLGPPVTTRDRLEGQVPSAIPPAVSLPPPADPRLTRLLADLSERRAARHQRTPAQSARIVAVFDQASELVGQPDWATLIQHRQQLNAADLLRVRTYLDRHLPPPPATTTPSEPEP